MWGNLSDVGSVLPPLGLCYLAAVSRDCGYQTSILDCYAENLTTIQAIERLCSHPLDIVGISSTTQEIGQAAKLAAGIKNRRPETMVIVGGVHVTSSPVETLKRYPQFDLAFIGESESTLPEFLDAYQNQSSLTNIAGLALRRNHVLVSENGLATSSNEGDHDIFLTPRRAPVKNLDALPLPSFDLLPRLREHYLPAITNYKRSPVIGLVTSRGCPGRCTFCDRSVFGNHLRMLSAERILEIIEILQKVHGIREICFYDDTLVAHRARFRDLCEQMVQKKLDLTWSCNARVDMVDPELLSLMRRAGCWQISYGIETADQTLLDRLKKGTTVEQAEQAIVWSKKAGFAVKGYYMIGLPGETLKSLKKTEEQVLKLPLDDILLEYCTPFPGTEIHDRLQGQGIQIPDWELLNTFEAAYIPPGLDSETLESAFKRIIRRFYLRPQIIGGYARRFADPLKMARLARNFIKFLMRG
jgi:radical SAM superfamily enzyme YgiQ (UPF0313 family)